MGNYRLIELISLIGLNFASHPTDPMFYLLPFNLSCAKMKG